MTQPPPYERPDRRIIGELETLARHAADELAGWRRRCLRAEAEVQELRGRTGTAVGPDLAHVRARVVELEQENLILRERLEAVRQRVTALTTRFSFLERGLEEVS